MNSEFSIDRWLAIAERVGLASPRSVYTLLQTHYSESWRDYHNVTHIADCLEQFDTLGEAEHPVEVELAIWFHDAIYDTHGTDNEARSAQLAVEVLAPAEMASDALERVQSLIMATTHSAKPTRADEQLVVDVDLSILGREADVYDRFESAIRAEYAWVPWLVYAEKRAEILATFAARAKIYGTSAFANRYEKTARANLARAIKQLRA